MKKYNEKPYPCVFCDHPTEFGAGRFVNRIPAGTWHQFDDGTEEYRDGYACAECMAPECDRCGNSIPLDEDISPCLVYSENDPRHFDIFEDGAFRVHEHCLTAEETAHYLHNALRSIYLEAGEITDN